jgi:hypothetical protein
MKGILLKFRWAALCRICLLAVASFLFLHENFHIDIAGRRIFFLDKGGVLRVFDSHEMKMK